MDIPKNALILVADGAKLLLFRNAGEGGNVELETVGHEKQSSPPTHAQGTDKPGISHSSTGSGRSGLEGSDFHQQDEDRFAHHAADLLKRAALEGWADAIVVVAPPRALGEMRKHYHKDVTSRIVAEINKDLTGHPVAEIARALTAN